jgi:Mg2+ and Co2+ transporter CorA
MNVPVPWQHDYAGFIYAMTSAAALTAVVTYLLWKKKMF